MRTFSAKAENVNREWLLIDAKGLPIGRLASEVARILQGKHKPIYTRHVDTGDAIVIINAGLVAATGSKEETKVYFRHTGYPGGLKKMSLGQLRGKHPTRILEFAVKGMLPRSSLGREMFRKLHIYVGAEHPHSAQQPRLISIESERG